MARKTKKTTDAEVYEVEIVEDEWRKIEFDLLEQLKKKGLTQQHYRSLVADYIALWQIKQNLIQDIQARGVISTYNNGGGQTGTKKNESIEQVVKVSVQMLKILDSLGLQGTKVDVRDTKKAKAKL
ncbi:MAG: P27 family phage terminase small subunit [Peptostreptococcaceae bacterium]|nr:P27 family phage terminase small subunit [Peptostreptococcaceae bacterium]